MSLIHGMSPLPKRAVNLPPWGRSENCQPFINLIHNDSFPWSLSNTGTASPDYTDSAGWLTGLPHNTSRYKHPLVDIEQPWGVVRLGRYFCTWTGPANLFSFVTDSNVNGGNVVINDNKCAVDVTAIGAEGTTPFYCSIRCNNQTGAPIDVDHTSNLAVYHEDDEADFLLGKTFQQSFLDTLEGCSVLRFMDWFHTNTSIILNDFVGDNTCTSGTNSTTINGPNLPTNTTRQYIGISAGAGAGQLAKVTAINSATSVTVVDADTGLPLAVAPDTSSIYRTYQIYRDVADYNVETDCTWYTVPFSVCARLCEEVGADPWVNFGLAWTDDLIENCISEFEATLSAARKWYVEPGNETWNTAAGFAGNNMYCKDFMFSRISATNTSGNPATRKDADAGSCATLDLAMKFCKAVETVVGRSRVVRIMPSWWGSPTSGAGMFEYLDPGYFAVGGKAITRFDALAYAPYFNMQSVGSFSNVQKTVLMQKQYETAGYFAATLRAGVAYWAGSFANSVESQRAAKAPNCQLIGYEGGADMQFQGTTSVVGAINSGDNTLLISDGTDMTVYCEDGETVTVSESAGGAFALFTGQNNFTPYYVKVVSSTKIRFFATLADYNNDTAATLNGSRATYTIDSSSRKAAMRDAISAYMATDDAATVYADYYEKQYRQRRFLLLNQFYSCGGYRGFPWGLLRSQYDADTPRMTYWKTLP